MGIMIKEPEDLEFANFITDLLLGKYSGELIILDYEGLCEDEGAEFDQSKISGTDLLDDEDDTQSDLQVSSHLPRRKYQLPSKICTAGKQCRRF